MSEATLTAEQAVGIDSSAPAHQLYGTGRKLKDAQERAVALEAAQQSYTPVELQILVTADATAGKPLTVPFAMEVDLMMVEARATVTSGKITLKKGTTAMTEAVACETDTTRVAASAMVAAQEVLAKGDVINAVASGSTVRGKVTILGHRL
jgi:hypothetical protein